MTGRFSFRSFRSLSVLFVLLAPAALQAQIEVPGIPAAFADSTRIKLRAEHDRLVRDAAKLEAASALHNKKCRGLAAESAEAASCTVRRDSLNTAALSLKARLDDFQQAIAAAGSAELEELDKQQTSLSEQIKSGLDKMRELADDVKKGSSEQMRTLNVQVQKWIDLRRRFEVRRQQIASAVRG